MPVPFLLFHRGDSYYLAHTVAQLKQTNPESPILFLGDKSNSYYSGVRHYNYDNYRDKDEKLARFFDADVISTHSFNRWNFFLFQKWFFIRAFLKQNSDYLPCVLIDSDVLIYGPIQQFVQKYHHYELTVCNPLLASKGLGASANPGVAWIKSKQILDLLCEEIDNLLKEPDTINPYINSRGHIGVTEMAALHRLLVRKPGIVANTELDDEDIVIQSSMIGDERFLISKGLQVIDWHSGKPYGFKDSEEKRRVFFFALHFHGHTKKIMYKYLTLRRPQVIFQWLWNWGRFKVYKYPRRFINWFIGRTLFPKL